MTINKIAEWLKEQDNIIIACHVLPDCDTLGSAVAIKMALDALNKTSCVVCHDRVPDIYKFLPGFECIIFPCDIPFKASAALSVDAGDLFRLGSFAPIFEAIENNALIDHHGTNPGFAKLNYIDANAGATAEIAIDLINLLGVEISKDMAYCLYAAISTDTGNFNFKSTSPVTMQKAGLLIDKGADVQYITRNSFRLRSPSRIALMGRVFSSLKYLSNGKIVYGIVTNDMLAETGANAEDTEGIVSMMNDIKGVSVAILGREVLDGVKFSFRTPDSIDVSEIAKHFNGGGHKQAAGATLKGNTLELTDTVVKYVESVVS